MSVYIVLILTAFGVKIFSKNCKKIVGCLGNDFGKWFCRLKMILGSHFECKERQESMDLVA
jgi:hypothetical protein